MGNKKPRNIDFSKLNLVRLAHSYLNEKTQGNYGLNDINILNGYFEHLISEKNQDLPKYNVGVMLVCINQPYWQYAVEVLNGITGLFLPGHNVEKMVWTDIPPQGSKEEDAVLSQFKEKKDILSPEDGSPREDAKLFLETFWSTPSLKVFHTDSIEWPYPTLMRYHLFLGQEEYLKKFDYLFYIDLDMRIVNIVGDEILGEGLTAAQHPMYALPQNLWMPYEPNPESTAHISMPGRVTEKNGQKLFEPLYAAGGIQGGVTGQFISAMKTMKTCIDQDFNKNYVARWNDESHWNKYLQTNHPSVVLPPAYVYPDSMIEEYYKKKVWGRDFVPRIITITKPFSTSKEGGEAARKLMQEP